MVNPSVANCSDAMTSPCDACTSAWTPGEGVFVGGAWASEAVVCGPTDQEGVLASSCSGLTLVGDFGDACRKACASDPTICATKAKAYCSAASTKSNFDCSCLSPTGRTWGSTTYAALDDFVKKSGLTFDTRCVWPACAASRSQSIIRDPTQNCPSASLQCTVGNFTVTLSDVQSGDINLISQNCGTIHSGDAARQGKDGKVFGWTTTQFLIFLIVLLACVGIFCAAAIVAFKAYRASKAAAADSSALTGAAV